MDYIKPHKKMAMGEKPMVAKTPKAKGAKSSLVHGPRKKGTSQSGNMYC